ncbi:MAG TPA: DUF4097 family beta strand repeat-containing protein [archaeon]|nr:DUF4097 family beta strand repeat-containing protein [archaeon]
MSIVNGPMLFEELKGKLTTHSVTGATQVQFAGLDFAELNSVSGKITVGLPSYAAMNLAVSTISGELEIDPRLKIQGSRNSRTVEGKLNGGGPLVAVSSVIGKISIEVL